MCLQWQKVDDEHAYIRRAALREINSRLGGECSCVAARRSRLRLSAARAALRAAFETGGAVAFENAPPVAMPTHLVAKQLTAYSSMALALRHYIGARERISNRFSVVATMPLTPRKSQLLPHSRQNSSQLPAHALAVAPPSPRSMQPLPPSPPRPREQPSDEDLDGWRRHSFVSPQVKREVLRQVRVCVRARRGALSRNALTCRAPPPQSSGDARDASGACARPGSLRERPARVRGRERGLGGCGARGSAAVPHGRQRSHRKLQGRVREVRALALASAASAPSLTQPPLAEFTRDPSWGCCCPKPR
jgi:hypothetical protein